MFLDKRGCKIANRISNIQSKNITTTAIELDNLQPYSIYNISVSAVTKKGQGDMQSILGYTDEAKTIDINMFNRKITTLETSIQIGLVVECENWNGPIYLSAYAICKSEWCEGEEMNMTKYMQYNDLITLDSLLPYTNYKLEVNFLRNEVDRINDYNKSWSTAVMTLSSVPNQVSFAEVYSLSETSISLRWSPPYPPTGILDLFLIKYYYFSKGYSTQQTVINYLSPCKIWPNMYCTTLTNLTTNQNYIISIAGRNQAISSYGVETFFNETTLIRAPQPPQNLVAKWDTSRILHLQWEHPNRTNGPFSGFKICINDHQYLYEGPGNTTYNFKTSFQCKHAIYRNAIVSIQTINSEFTSALLAQQFVCPIFKPSLSTEPFRRRNVNNSITISMPIIENAEAISNLYIILLANELDDTGDCKEKLGDMQNSLVPKKGIQRCWIVAHYNKSEYKDIEKTEINFNLTQLRELYSTSDQYEVGILIVNEFDGQISSNWYLVKMYYFFPDFMDIDI
ncbi:neural cell adhesion molecule L1-like isoform X4 [Atheta coriaria]|uniref:neural cell adhesion molecule L1-like isoform X4 n=1 Tax=Dalotia coriaria TaxID=877792 RepID=UPI0031F35949